MVAAQTRSSRGGAAEESRPLCAAFRFAVDGDLRFLSHHDELRMLSAALRRAGWPVAYSRGFNPQPRLVLPLPRRVGCASQCEWAVARLEEPRPIDELHESLARALPPACRLQCVVMLTTNNKLHPRRALYAIELERAHAEQAAGRIAGLLAAESLTVERTYGPDKPPRSIDIRPYIENVTLEGCTLWLQLAFADQRSARPIEVLTVIDLPAGAYNHRVRRVEVEWDFGPAASGPEAAGMERNNVGRKESCSQT